MPVASPRLLPALPTNWLQIGYSNDLFLGGISLLERLAELRETHLPVLEGFDKGFDLMARWREIEQGPE